MKRRRWRTVTTLSIRIVDSPETFPQFLGPEPEVKTAVPSAV